MSDGEQRGVPVRIDDAIDGRAWSLEGERLELTAPRAYAPGQPMRLSFSVPGVGDADAESALVSARSRGSKRAPGPGDAFLVTVRLVDLRRTTRERLAVLLDRAPSAT